VRLLPGILARLGSRPGSIRADPSRNPACERFEVDAWLTSDFVLERLVPRVGVRPFPLHELLLMTAAVVRLRPPLVLEWGTHVGKSAWIFRETIASFGISSHVHSVDLPADASHVEHPGRRRGEMVRGLSGVTLHEGDGLDVAVRVWAMAGRPPAPLFFLDGDHARASVLREVEGVAVAVPGAAILLHDTFFQSSGSGYNIGPHLAVEEVLAQHPGRWEVLRSGLGLPGMTLLVPRSASPSGTAGAGGGASV
jgi:cephalosporin hydroxylase